MQPGIYIEVALKKDFKTFSLRLSVEFILWKTSLFHVGEGRWCWEGLLTVALS